MLAPEPSPDTQTALPDRFASWFAGRGWAPRSHQLALLAHAREKRDALLIAPTGAGKTLAGFLPSLIELADGRETGEGLHTIYVSPLKALAVDVARNLTAPVAEMGLPIRIEGRTGDTPAGRRKRQKQHPPDMLLTTPEQLALLIGDPGAARLFETVRRVVVDELHALAPTKRGDQLALALARIRALAPDVVTVGLSATVRAPAELRRWLVDPRRGAPLAELVEITGGAAPDITVHETDERLPWSGHGGRHAMAEIYEAIRRHKTTLLFANTRAQAELTFQELWRINEDTLPIALHHGSLDVGQRRKVEAAMAEGRLKAIVATSTLDLGIDWGDVDLVVHMSSPKGASRLLQRTGRANHRLDEPSKAIIVPANRFEVLECEAARDAALAGDQDAEAVKPGGLDVLAQHILGVACGTPFDEDDLFAEVVSTAPYAALDRKTFDDVIQFVATGGYALKSYDRFAKIRRTPDGLWRVSNPSVAQAWRMNVGTIIEASSLKVRMGRVRRTAAGAVNPAGYGGRLIGEIEEYFVETMTPGDTFMFGGEILKYEALIENEIYVSRSNSEAPKVPTYVGGRMPLTTGVAARVRAILDDPSQWTRLPTQTREWLGFQQERSVIPDREKLLVETFPRAGKYFLVTYPFEGRLAHQTLGMLMTRRLERAHARPLGFVASDHALAIWGLGDVSAMIAGDLLSLDQLFDEDMLGDDLEAWLAESSLMKRTFRNCAIIAGLIERNVIGAKRKTGRQVTMSTDLVYDVLRRHEPDHVLLRAAYQDAAGGLIDLWRVADFLKRVKQHIEHRPLDRVSPLAIPILLEVGREPVYGAAQDALLREAAETLVEEAMGPLPGTKGAGPPGFLRSL
ncbi:ligase-associated DNA damage response DEXH box helicase [Chelatococcus sambhunathii]|uniref:Ligase-associated DNA damage response DEXH box helicase n=1 Tax=Chelatococcus sambhunathii TaxID=363953 RepID=A0ABU1DFT7_9HYPH|nr:ligase-associated DNA damage response DEXH box helicase [Chelatococcus sambhunathii]MDR4306770.1 ligase-associated DNA damage response DEXH box helicase [Chelatococcus sambhunathii]